MPRGLVIKRLAALSGSPHSCPMPAAAEERFISPKALMAIRNLELRARVVVEGFWTGLHRSPYHGFSVEFTEYRQYSPGDDPRYLDWRLLARSDRCYVKKFEDETNLRCRLRVDNSRSMGFGSVGYTKAEYGRTLAATLAWFLHQQGDATGLLTFDEAIRDYLPARHKPGHLRHLMLALEKNLASLTASGHEVLLFHLLDPAEVNLRFDRAALFLDSESNRELYIDPVAARSEYQRKLSAHTTATRGICDKLGISYHQMTTDRPLELALFDFLRSRMQRRGRRAR